MFPSGSDKTSLGYLKAAITGLLKTIFEYPWGSGHESRLRALPPPERLRAGRQSATPRRHGHESRYSFDYVGYFLSPLDFLNECLIFFFFKAAFKRFVFLRLFIFSSVCTLTPTLSLDGEGEIEGLVSIPIESPGGQ